MQGELISARNLVCVIIAMVFGSSMIMVVQQQVKQDTWISALFSLLLVVPLILIYARLMKLMPEKDLFEMSTEVFGNVGGKIAIVLVALYGLHVCAIVLRDFYEFIQVTALPETPKIVIILTLSAAVITLCKNGIGVLGKWSFIVVVLSIIALGATLIFSIPSMDVSNIFPIMQHEAKDIAWSSFSISTLPFGETVLILTLANGVRKHNNPYKVYLAGIGIGFVVALILFFRALLLLGAETLSATYFPYFTDLRIMRIGTFLEKIEAIITFTYIIAGITKASVSLFAASKGAAKLFNVPNYRDIVVPVGLLAVALCSFLVTDIMQFYSFIQVYPVYAVPFQVVIPLLLWITAEIKLRRKAKKEPMYHRIEKKKVSGLS